jgi:hypothetical protein
MVFIGLNGEQKFGSKEKSDLKIVEKIDFFQLF